jgi:uncharacterized protein YndB with AHSA1/START domain
MKPRHLAATRAVIRKRLAAPRERVFRAWTEAAHLQQWFFPGPAEAPAPHVELDLRVGGRYCITRYAPDGTITAMVGGVYHEVKPPVKLVFSWAWEAPDPDPSETLVTVELYETDGTTEMIITHEHFPVHTEQETHTIGWICCLERLLWLVEAAPLQPALVAHQELCR